MKTRRTVTVKERPPLPLTIVGAGRAARAALPTLVELNTTHRLAPLYLDASPGKALDLADEAKQRGLAASAWETRIEDVVAELPPEQLQQLLLNLDHGTPTAEVLERALQAQHVLAYQVIKPASGPPFGIRIYLPPDDPARRLETALFFRTTGRFTLRRGSQAILGAGGESADREGEPLLRAWMAEHTREVLRKTIAQLPPEVFFFEVTDDFGETTMPAFIRGAVAFSEPELLARSILEQPPEPLRRGMEFLVIELVPALGIRWHKARLRGDGRIIVERAATHERPPQAVPSNRPNTLAATTTVLARAERNEITATNAMLSTD